MLKLLKKIFKIKSYVNKGKGFNIVGDLTMVTIEPSASFGGRVLIYALAPITIGEHTMIGINTIIHTGSHDYKNHPMWIERIDRPVEIGKHVWIGASVIICSGVKIGNYSVIGAGSVITKHVPEYSIVAGNPARILGYRYNINVEANVDPYPNNSYITKKDFLELENETKKKDNINS